MGQEIDQMVADEDISLFSVKVFKQQSVRFSIPTALSENGQPCAQLLIAKTSNSMDLSC